MTRERERTYRVEAIVVGRREYGETDRIVTLFSRERGKIAAIAKGARKPTARAGPALEYFARGRYMLAKGRDLEVVANAELIERPIQLEGNLTRLAQASHMAELTDKLAQEGQHFPALYDLLAESLRSLGQRRDDACVVRWFEIAALAEVGYPLDLWTCSSCMKPLEAEPNYLGLQSGGMLCASCRGSEGRSLLLSVNAQKYLRLLTKSGRDAAEQVTVGPVLAIELERAMAAFIGSVLERDLTSLRVLREIRERSPDYAV
jgi:DNA repair protein RecO (recombination protein O)